MIVVRNVFQLKFGKTREAQELWKEGMALMEKMGFRRGASRVLTDVVADFYTLVVETTFDSLADWESAGKKMMAEQGWRDWYAKVVPLVESGRREVLQVVE